MTTNHTLKCDPQVFDDVKSGKKRFEVRRADREFTEGDVVTLVEYDQVKQQYTGRVVLRSINYVLTDAQHYGLKDGFTVFGIVPFAKSFIAKPFGQDKQIGGDCEDTDIDDFQED